MNGIIPTIFKRIYCILWRGHTYKRVTPFDLPHVVIECTYCKKQKVV